MLKRPVVYAVLPTIYGIKRVAVPWHIARWDDHLNGFGLAYVMKMAPH